MENLEKQELEYLDYEAKIKKNLENTELLFMDIQTMITETKISINDELQKIDANDISQNVDALNEQLQLLGKYGNYLSAKIKYCRALYDYAQKVKDEAIKYAKENNLESDMNKVVTIVKEDDENYAFCIEYQNAKMKSIMKTMLGSMGAFAYQLSECRDIVDMFIKK